MTRTGSRFRRVEPRRRALVFVLGLLAELPRKNCWTIAEHAGDPSPDGMQHLLARAKWDVDGPGPADQIPSTSNEIAHLLQPDYPARARHLAPDALVTLATPPPAPRPDLPLPKADSRGPRDITIYGWRY